MSEQTSGIGSVSAQFFLEGAMKKEIAEKWVTALRSGEYKQGKDVLADTHRTQHCCLGVLCEVAIKEDLEVEVQIIPGHAAIFDNSKAFLPHTVADWAGMKTRLGDLPIGVATTTVLSLMSMNDGGHSFGAIANVIETHWEEL